MTESVTVRVSSLDDSASITSVLQLCYPALMRLAYDAELLNQVLPRMTTAQPRLLQSGSYYVAEAAGGAIVGCGGWTKERPGSGEIKAEIGHIRHFGVHPGWIRRGVGKSIYARCELDAQDAGITRFECYSSLNGEKFYSALGFRRLGQIDVPFFNGVTFPSVHMVADL